MRLGCWQSRLYPKTTDGGNNWTFKSTVEVMVYGQFTYQSKLGYVGGYD
ncbi:MAG: hypothetical protein IPI19_10475 [Ignavibacteriales bacterium]|nr:hypothetical protein [Ignavibacteriales bacterium]